MKSSLFQTVRLIACRANWQTIRLVLAILALILLVLGSGAPESGSGLAG